MMNESASRIGLTGTEASVSTKLMQTLMLTLQIKNI